MYKKYLKNSLILFVISMSIIASVNFIIDPGEIYLKKILTNIKSSEFSDKLINSKYGIIQTGWNERLVKTSLSKKASQYDCVILGSSHIMQISHTRNTGNIRAQCQNILNLGVSGGSIEDISIFTYLILNNIQLPNKVFIEISPWTLKFNMDSRYGAYKEYYEKMNQLLKLNDMGSNVSYLSQISKNLFNGEYFYYSLQELFKDTIKVKKKNNIFDKKIKFPKSFFDYETGYEEGVTLPDGSHVYNKAWILKQKKNNSKIKLGGGNYKISGSIYDKKTLIYLEKIINLYKKNKTEVNLILTPYHPNVFKKGTTKTVKHLKKIEKVIKKISTKNKIKLYGSYFPNNIGCKGIEFFDYMHATNKCLNKIDFTK